MSEVAEEPKSATKTESSDLANGGLKEKKEISKGGEPWNTGGRGRGRGRGLRGGFRGSFRGRRGGGFNISTKYLDEKAMYLIFEKPINTATAKEVMAFGKDASTVGFGRGCTIHFKTPDEAKDFMAKIKEAKFGGMEPKVEYAYKKRVVDPVKRRSGTEEEDEEEEVTSQTKKLKVEDEETESKKEEEEEKGDTEERVEGEEAGEEEEAEAENEAEGAEGEEAEGAEYEDGDEGGDYEQEGEEYEQEGEEYEQEGDYTEEGQEEGYEGGEGEGEAEAEGDGEEQEEDADEEEFQS